MSYFPFPGGKNLLLSAAFTGMLLSFSLIEANVYSSPAEGLPGPVRQEITVSGTVFSEEDGTPLPGVTVQVAGTGQAVMTDLEGGYEIDVPDEDAELEFSFVGYLTQTVRVASQTVIDISLAQDLQSLDEVVVVGYGTQRASEVAVAIGRVEGEEIASRGTVAPLQGMQGQVAGVDISAGSGRAGADYNIQIRGQNSLAGGEPLYVVDGVIVSDITFLNPQDIEKIDVLKDAASTAIYGSRGSNGVVLVTTKGGTSVKSKATISYDGYMGIRRSTRMPDFMEGPDWWEYRQNTYISPAMLAGEEYDENIGGLETSDILARRVREGDYTNWRDLVLRTGQQANHWLTVSGMSDNNISYLIGAGYQNEKGNLINESMSRYNFKASVDAQLSEKWSAGMNVNFSVSEQELGSDLAVMNAFRMSPVVKPYDDEGNLVFRPGQVPSSDGTSLTSMTSSVNPLLDNANSENNTRRNFGVGNLYLQFQPAGWIDIRSTFSPRVDFERNGRYWGAQTENRGGQDPSAQMEKRETFSYILDNMVTIRKNFNDHNFTFTGLHSIQEERFESNIGRVNNLPFNSSYLNLGASSDREILGSDYWKFSIVSVMGRINYSFRDKFLVMLATRWDGSSMLAEGHKWAAFPSASIAWRLTEEDFMKDSRWLTELKARFSAGLAGNNDNISPYETQMVLSDPYFYDFGGNPALGFAPSRLPNPLLTWEKTREYNFGIDYGLWEGRLSGSIDVYDKLSDGVLMSRDLPLEGGWSDIKDNVGSVRNRGIELALTMVNVSTENLTWTTSFNFARNVNSIQTLLDREEDLVGNDWFIGEPINVNYTYVYEGVWQEHERDEAAAYGQLPGQAKVGDLNDDGAVNENDRRIIGQQDPKWTGGFSTRLTYKRFDLSASLFARQGMQAYSPFHAEFTNLQDRGRSKIYMDYYMPENDVTRARQSNRFPQPNNVGPYWPEVGYYYDASFVKVQNISLGYNLPPEVLQRAGIGSLRVYMNVLNPFVWTDYSGFDPEYAAESMNETGVSTVTWQFGINLNF